MEAIGELKNKIREKGNNMEEKDFDKIMMKSGSQAGLDPKKGEKTKARTDVIGQIKENKDRRNQLFPHAKKGDKGRIGSGRFNR